MVGFTYLRALGAYARALTHTHEFTSLEKSVQSQEDHLFKIKSSSKCLNMYCHLPSAISLNTHTHTHTNGKIGADCQEDRLFKINSSSKCPSL